MARARCTDCRAHVWWTASRGARLADVRCPSCGGRLVGGRAAGPVPRHESGRTCIVCRVHRELGDPLLVELDARLGACRGHPAEDVEAEIARVWGWTPLDLLLQRPGPRPPEVIQRYRAALERKEVR